jgi:hypothetical protein
MIELSKHILKIDDNNIYILQLTIQNPLGRQGQFQHCIESRIQHMVT